MLAWAYRRRWPSAAVLAAGLWLAATGAGAQSVAPLVSLRTLASQGAREVSTILRGAAMRGSLRSSVDLLNEADLNPANVDALFALAVEGRLGELPALKNRPELIPVIEQWARSEAIPVRGLPPTSVSATTRMTSGCSEDGICAVLHRDLAPVFTSNMRDPQELFLSVRRHRIGAVIDDNGATSDPLESVGIAVPDTPVLTAEDLIDGIEEIDLGPIKAAGIRPIAGFDLDGAVMGADGNAAFLEFLIARDALTPEGRLALKRLDDTGETDSILRIAAAVTGMTPPRAQKLAYDFYTEGIRGRTVPWLSTMLAMDEDPSRSIAEIIARLCQRGMTVVPTTTGFTFMARGAAQALSLSPQLAVTSTLEVKLGRYTGTITRNLGETGTLGGWAEDVGEAPLMFFGHTLKTDGPLMQYAAQGFMVHPTPEFLAANDMLKAGFRTLTFRTPDQIEVGKATASQGAVNGLRDGDVVGVGVGSTTAQALRILGKKLSAGELHDVRVAASRPAVGQTARDFGITVARKNAHVDVVIDGAEEVDPNGFLIKGLGPALVREKHMARQASAQGRFHVIVTPDKLVDRLGTTKPVPVEIEASLLDDPVRAAEWEAMQRALKKLGGKPQVREIEGVPAVTDAGNHVVDLYYKEGIRNPVSLAAALDDLPGVVAHGLFIDLADFVHVGEGHALVTQEVVKSRVFRVEPGPGGLPRFANEHVDISPAAVDFSLLGPESVRILEGVRTQEIGTVTGFVTLEEGRTVFHVTGVPD